MRFIFFIFFLVFSNFALAVDKLTVVLDWFPNPNHGPLLIAQQKDFFQQQGLEVTLIGPANPADPPKLVAAHKADIAISYPQQVLLDQKQGLPLVSIGALVDYPLGCIAASAESHIHRIQDFKNKTIAYAVSGVDILNFKTILHTAGLNLNDVNLINVNYNLAQALMTHRVDAAIGLMRNFELIQFKLAHFPVRVFYPEQYGVSAMPELIFIVNQEDFKHYLEKFQRFLKAVQQGKAYIQAHPEESWKLISDHYPELNNPLNKQAFFATLPYWKNK